MSVILNGLPDDPIKLQPFHKIFSCTNIWKLWCKVGFITLNQNMLYNNKAQQQLSGEKAEVGNYGQQLQLLAENHKMVEKEIIEMGFNGGLPYLELEVVQSQQVIGKIVTKAAMKQIEMNNKKKAAQLETKIREKCWSNQKRLKMQKQS